MKAPRALRVCPRCRHRLTNLSLCPECVLAELTGGGANTPREQLGTVAAWLVLLAGTGGFWFLAVRLAFPAS